MQRTASKFLTAAAAVANVANVAAARQHALPSVDGGPLVAEDNSKRKLETETGPVKVYASRDKKVVVQRDDQSDSYKVEVYRRRSRGDRSKRRKHSSSRKSSSRSSSKKRSSSKDKRKSRRKSSKSSRNKKRSSSRSSSKTKTTTIPLGEETSPAKVTTAVPALAAATAAAPAAAAAFAAPAYAAPASEASSAISSNAEPAAAAASQAANSSGSSFVSCLTGGVGNAIGANLASGLMSALGPQQQSSEKSLQSVPAAAPASTTIQSASAATGSVAAESVASADAADSAAAASIVESQAPQAFANSVADSVANSVEASVVDEFPVHSEQAAAVMNESSSLDLDSAAEADEQAADAQAADEQAAYAAAAASLEADVRSLGAEVRSVAADTQSADTQSADVSSLGAAAELPPAASEAESQMPLMEMLEQSYDPEAGASAPAAAAHSLETETSSAAEASEYAAAAEPAAAAPASEYGAADAPASMAAGTAVPAVPSESVGAEFLAEPEEETRASSILASGVVESVAPAAVASVGSDIFASNSNSTTSWQPETSDLPSTMWARGEHPPQQQQTASVVEQVQELPEDLEGEEAAGNSSIKLDGDEAGNDEAESAGEMSRAAVPSEENEHSAEVKSLVEAGCCYSKAFWIVAAATVVMALFTVAWIARRKSIEKAAKKEQLEAEAESRPPRAQQQQQQQSQQPPQDAAVAKARLAIPAAKPERSMDSASSRSDDSWVPTIEIQIREKKAD